MTLLAGFSHLQVRLRVDSFTKCPFRIEMREMCKGLSLAPGIRSVLGWLGLVLH